MCVCVCVCFVCDRYATKYSPNLFGIFDSFATEEARDAHLNGEVAKALGAQADTLFTQGGIDIQKVDILATK